MSDEASGAKRKAAAAVVTPDAKKGRSRSHGEIVDDRKRTPEEAAAPSRRVGSKQFEEQAIKEEHGNGKNEEDKASGVIEHEGETLMGFGKYHDKTFRQVYAAHRGYYNFLKSLPDPDARMERFMDWFEKNPGQKPRISAASTTKQRVNAYDAVFVFGKHRGKTFSDVFFEHADYEQWARSQAEPTGQLREFLQWIDAFHKSLHSPVSDSSQE